MSVAELLVTIASGLAVNECCDVSPMLARTLARWSARRHYANPVRGEQRAEEWAAYINDRPGKLFKLLVAAGFAGRVLVCGRDMRGETARGAPYQPAPPIRLEFQGEPRGDLATWRERKLTLEVALWTVEEDVRIASRLACRFGTATDRLYKLAKVTGDTRWMVVAAKLEQLRYPSEHFRTYRPQYVGQPMSGVIDVDTWQWTNTPTQMTVDAYVGAVRQLRGDIRRICEESWPGARPTRKRRDCPLISGGWLHRLMYGWQGPVVIPSLEPEADREAAARHPSTATRSTGCSSHTYDRCWK